MKIKCNNIYTDLGKISGYLEMNNGKIVDIIETDNVVGFDRDYSDYVIIPGIIDTHNHGSNGYSLMSDIIEEDEIKGYLKCLGSHGVTSVLATANCHIVDKVANVANSQYIGAKIVGIHTEGPYLNRVGEKGIRKDQPKIDMDDVKAIVENAQGLLKLVAIAPEIDGAKEVIDYLTEKGIRCAFAHSDCDYHEAMTWFDKGLTVTTHTANVMSGIHHRDMGGLGACLLHDDVWNEVICDGLHVSNEMLKIMFRVKPTTKFMMISDNVAIANAPCGRYDLSGLITVTVDEQGLCLSDTGRICGSTKSVLYGIANLVNNLNMPIEYALMMSSYNPAKVYDLPSKGQVTKGYDADIVVIDLNYNVIETFSEGNSIYHIDEGMIFNDDFIMQNKINS